MQGSTATRAPAGLYIHVPFCRRRCPFCDFAITTDRSRVEAWRAAVEREMDLRAGDWDLPFDTVYFGGGTPSVLPAAVVSRVLERARRRFAIAPGAEVTLEANPGTLAPDDFGRLAEAGVNRLSLGAQSFDDAHLVLLGRDHSAAETLESFAAARAAGLRNITIDLIYGLPGVPASGWEAQMERAASLAPEHISAYQLTIEPATALGRRRDRGEVEELTDAEAADLFLLTHRRLGELGYAAYEVSSFARAPEFRSRHNRKYWEGAPYLGLGPSAHSYRDPERSWNAPRLEDYIGALEAGRLPTAGREELDADQRKLERLFLGLRTARGLALDGFAEEFGDDLRASRKSALRALAREGLAVLEMRRLALTPRGLAMADGIALRLASPDGKPGGRRAATSSQGSGGA